MKDLSLKPAESETIQALNSPELELSFPAADVEEPAEEPVDASGACAQADSDKAAAAKTAGIARCNFFTDCLLEQTMIQRWKTRGACVADRAIKL